MSAKKRLVIQLAVLGLAVAAMMSFVVTMVTASSSDPVSAASGPRPGEPRPTPTREARREPAPPLLGRLAAPLAITSPTTAAALAQAMGIKAADIVQATLGSSDPDGAGVGVGPLGNYFPTEGNTFAILSTGLAAKANAPNAQGNLSAILEGLNNVQGNDMVQLRLKLRVPQNMNCASFGFAFYSEEFPEFLDSPYNDTFTAELGGTNLSISNTTVVAPLNFAFDTEKRAIAINSTDFTASGNTGTTYDGATPLLRAQTPITPGATVDFVFSVQDLGDSIWDSAVFLDKFFWSNDPLCDAGVQQELDLYLPLVLKNQ